MGNCLSKFNGKCFTLHTPPLTSGHLKIVASGTRNNPVNYFALGVHRNYGYERFIQNIIRSLMDAYDRFPPQSCQASFIKEGGIKDILCYPKRSGTLCYPFRIIFKHFSFCIRPRIKPALNEKIDRLYQGTTRSCIYWPNEIWKNSPCFRLN